MLTNSQIGHSPGLEMAEASGSAVGRPSGVLRPDQ